MIEHDRHRAGQVQTGNTVLHGDGHPVVSAVQQFFAEPLSLSAKGHQCPVRDTEAWQRVAAKVDGHQRTVTGRHGYGAGHREGELQTHPVVKAAGFQGSRFPVFTTPAAPAAAAARTAAPMLNRFLGFSSRTTGAGAGLSKSSARSTAGRRAMANTPVGGLTGASLSNTSSGPR